MCQGPAALRLHRLSPYISPPDGEGFRGGDFYAQRPAAATGLFLCLPAGRLPAGFGSSLPLQIVCVELKLLKAQSCRRELLAAYEEKLGREPGFSP